MTPIIQLKCFEPSGKTLKWDLRAILQHTICTGATGSGKTTAALNPMLRQLIAFESENPHRKMGMLILDPKSDETSEKVLEYAREANRENDVIVLSPRSTAYFSFWRGYTRLSQADEFTRRLLYASNDMGRENAYWTESRRGLLHSACVLLLAGCRPPVVFDQAMEFLSAFVYDPSSSLIKERIEFVGELVKEKGLRPNTRRQLEHALVEARNYAVLDGRTREIHKSTISNVIRPLMSAAAHDLFDESKNQEFEVADVLNGRILVASWNAVLEPALTAILFRLLKRDFCTAVLARVSARPEIDRLCGVIADEAALSLTPDDADVLPVMRSKGAFAIFAVQNLSSIDELVGRQRRNTLLANFGNCLFFCSRENAIDEFAFLTLGPMPDKLTLSEPDFANILTLEPHSGIRQYVCVPGTLARLGPHQAFAKLADGTVTLAPCWLEPLFHSYPAPQVTAESDDLMLAKRAVISRRNLQEQIGPRVQKFLLAMQERHHHLYLTQEIVAATWQVCVPRISRARLLARLRRRTYGRIAGLDTLPTCWLLGFNAWLQKNNSLQAMIVHVAVHSGVFWTTLDGAWPEGEIAIPRSINTFVYPSLWRAIKHRHLMRLLAERPDLRDDLIPLQRTISS